MSRIVLVRHGATAWTGHRYCGCSDPELSPAGFEQARAVAHRVAGLVPPGTSVIASPRRRALDTARRVAARIDGAIAVDERLAEVDFGAVEGRSFETVRRRWPAIAERLLAAELDIDWPGGESAMAFRTRIHEMAAALAAVPGDLVVVSHAGPIRALAALLGADAGGPDLDVEPGGLLVVPSPVRVVS